MKKEILKNNIQYIRRTDSSKIVLVAGYFNIIHPGHIRLINFAKSCGEKLFVCLFTDINDRSLISSEDRCYALGELESIDKIIKINSSELNEIISLLKPEVMVKGKEHEFDDNPEKNLILSYGGHFIFSAGEPNFSSLNLLRNELLNPAVFRLELDEIKLRNVNSSHSKILNILNKFINKKICVIGDLIVDEYINCEPLGMSQEDPTIVVSPINSNKFIGGAAIVAAHLASLGAEVTYIFVSGEDNERNFANDELVKYKINSFEIRDSSRPTILKQRYRAKNKTLLRINHLRSHDIENSYQDKIINYIDKISNDIDCIIFSDFNYGLITDKIISNTISLSKKIGFKIFLDSQSSSQLGDLLRYSENELISATEREARLALRDFRSGLQFINEQLLIKSNSNSLITKLGAEGLILTIKNQNDDGVSVFNLSAFNRNPLDTAGAGDALLAVVCLAMLNNATVFEAAYLGSVAAGVQVSRIGNIPLKLHEIAFHLT